MKGIAAHEQRTIDRIDYVWKSVAGKPSADDAGGSADSDSGTHLEIVPEHIQAKGMFTKLVCINDGESLVIEAPTAAQLCRAARLIVAGTIKATASTRAIIKGALQRTKCHAEALCLARQL